MSAAYDLTGNDIRGNIRRMALPAAVGLFCHTLYNMTDTFYVGFISTSAQSALAFAFPLYFILLSCCIGIGQGVTALTANALGKKRRARAAYFFAQGAVLSAFACGLIWLLLLPNTAALVTLIGGSGEAKNWAVDYMRLVYAGAPLFLFSFLLNAGLQAVGNTSSYRNSVIAAVLLNVVLDPIFMFGWFGLPALGVKGVAVATLLSQLFACVYLFAVIAGTVIIKRWRLAFMRPRLTLLRRLSTQAAAPTARMLCIGMFFFLITFFLSEIDGAAVAAYGIALRIEQMFLLPTIGLEVALLAYAGQNIGKGEWRQTKSAYFLCLRYGGIWFLIGGGLLLAGGPFFIRLFNQEEEVIRYGYHYLIAATFIGPLYLLSNLGGALLMGALRALDIAVVSVLRLLVLPALFFYLLVMQLSLGFHGILLGIVLSNIGAAWWMHRRGLAVISPPAAAAAVKKGVAV